MQTHARTMSCRRRTPGTTVTVQGWVHRRRTLAAVTFVVVRDRSGLAQVVVKDPATVAQVAEYGEETVVAVDRHGRRQPVGARRRRDRRPGVRAADRAGRDPAGRAVAARR